MPFNFTYNPYRLPAQSSRIYQNNINSGKTELPNKFENPFPFDLDKLNKKTAKYFNKEIDNSGLGETVNLNGMLVKMMQDPSKAEAYQQLEQLIPKTEQLYKNWLNDFYANQSKLWNNREAKERESMGEEDALSHSVRNLERERAQMLAEDNNATIDNWNDRYIPLQRSFGVDLRNPYAETTHLPNVFNEKQVDRHLEMLQLAKDRRERTKIANQQKQIQQQEAQETKKAQQSQTLNKLSLFGQKKDERLKQQQQKDALAKLSLNVDWQSFFDKQVQEHPDRSLDFFVKPKQEVAQSIEMVNPDIISSNEYNAKINEQIENQQAKENARLQALARIEVRQNENRSMESADTASSERNTNRIARMEALKAAQALSEMQEKKAVEESAHNETKQKDFETQQQQQQILNKFSDPNINLEALKKIILNERSSRYAYLHKTHPYTLSNPGAVEHSNKYQNLDNYIKHSMPVMDEEIVEKLKDLQREKESKESERKPLFANLGKALSQKKEQINEIESMVNQSYKTRNEGSNKLKISIRNGTAPKGSSALAKKMMKEENEYIDLLEKKVLEYKIPLEKYNKIKDFYRDKYNMKKTGYKSENLK